jgi:cytochrome c oxidase cbb3-type subunit 4
MTYDLVASFSQTSALLIFIGLTISVLAYAFWPGNRRRFDEAQRRALGLDSKEGNRGHNP